MSNYINSFSLYMELTVQRETVVVVFTVAFLQSIYHFTVQADSTEFCE